MTEARLDIRVNSTEVDRGKKSLDDLAQSGTKAEQGVGKATTATTGLSNAARAAAGVLVSLGAAMGVRDVIRYADEWQNASNRLRLVTASSQDLAAVQQTLLRTANDTRAGFAGTAELFTTLTRSTKDLGLSQREVIDLTKTINQSFAVSGASAGAMDGAIRQLAQGLQSGALRGDEFNSIAEQAPGILDAVAASLKMGRGELREFAATGGITAEVLVNAIQGYADVIDGEFASAQQTFGQSMLVAKNNMLEFVGGSDAVQGAASSAGRVVVALSENLDDLAAVAGIATLAIGTQYVAGLVATTSATTALTAATGALRAALLALSGPSGIVALAASGMYLLVQNQKASAEAAWKQAEAFDSVRASLAELTTTEVARAVQAEFDHIRAIKQKITAFEEAEAAGADMQDGLRRLNLELEAAKSNHGLLTRQLERLRDGWEPATAATEANTEATVLSGNAYERATALIENFADRLHDARERSSELREEQERAGEVAQKQWQVVRNAAVKAAEETEEAQGRAAEAAADQWRETHNYLSGAFVDLMNSGGNAWDNIAKGFERMVQRMVAEWAASGLMRMFGMGSPSPTSGVGTGAVNALMGVGGKALLTGGSQFLGGLTGGAIGTNAAMATGASSAGAGLAALATNPITWAVLGTAALAKMMDDSGTMSSNAGMLLHDVPGVSADRKFAVPAFDSGFQPIGMARRADEASAVAVIDHLRAYDSALTAIANAAGLSVNMHSGVFSGMGTSETGQGSGVFVGLASEDGTTKSDSVQSQADEFVRLWIEGLGAQIPADAKSEILSSSSADEMLAKAAALAGYDGSHANGLDYVPFDGYRAVLHKGEQVKSVAQQSSDSQMMAALLSSINSLLSVSQDTARSSKKTADYIERVTRGGEAMVTEAVA